MVYQVRTEVFVKIQGRQHYLWRAVDQDGDVVDVLLQRRRGGKAAKRFPATRRMAEKLAGADGKAHYAERKWISEAVNGWIKRVLGFRQFSVRGLNSASGEWDLVCLATNLRRMQPLIVLK